MIYRKLIEASKRQILQLTRQVHTSINSGTTLLLTFAMLLAGTASANANVPDVDSTQHIETSLITQQDVAKEQVTAADSVEINICRSKSFMRMGDSPDIKIAGNKVGEIGRGNMLKFQGKVNDELVLINNKNFLKYRFKDDLLLSIKIPSSPLYIAVKPLSNFAEAATIFFGRAIAEAIRQEATIGDSGNWSISILDPKDFNNQCAE